MAEVVRVADLPSTSNIDPNSYTIIEKPGYGEGTFKSTVRDLQNAITVTANIQKVGDETIIRIKDINGETSESLFNPSARVVDNGNGTVTIWTRDAQGETSVTILKDGVIVDPVPIIGSNNLITSGELYNLFNDFQKQIKNLDDRVAILEAAIEIVRYLANSETEDGEELQAETGEALVVPRMGSLAQMEAEGGMPAAPFMVDGAVYEDLTDAIAAAAGVGETVTLIGDASNEGVFVGPDSNFTIDLNYYTLTFAGPGAGSPGYLTQGLHIEKNSNVTIMNGGIVFNDPRIKMGIQNYSNLTLDNVTLWGADNVQYVVSNNYGNVVFRNETRIIPYGSNIAFDCWYGLSADYDVPGVFITIEDDSVQIVGQVEIGKARRATHDMFAEHASITCPTDMDLDVRILNPPCEWIDNGDGTKTLKYVLG